MNNTIDLSNFGYRELDMAAKLLTALSNGGSDFLGNEIAIEFNPNSGEVFLIDEDCNIAMEVDGELVQWCSCSNCGEEGLKEDDNFNHDTCLCDDCYKEENPDEFEDEED